MINDQTLVHRACLPQTALAAKCIAKFVSTVAQDTLVCTQNATSL
jgi:hypothetical protein